MNDNEARLIRDLRRCAASHRRDGERKTAYLLEEAAIKIEKLLNKADPSSTGEGVEAPVASGSLPNTLADPHEVTAGVFVSRNAEKQETAQETFSCAYKDCTIKGEHEHHIEGPFSAAGANDG